MNDALLLQRYAVDGSPAAFTELVQRHIGFVYHVALRQTGGDSALAEDAAHLVFVDLARKAGRLGGRPLVGWLYTSAKFAAAKLRRTEMRRLRREWEAERMKEINAPEVGDAAWQRLRPVIDEALEVLDEADRSAVLLRFFEGRTWSDIGDTLGLGEDTVRKRLDRALEKMAGVLDRRGIPSTGAALATVLATQSALAAPAGLAVSVSGAALVAPATAATVAGIFSMKLSTVVLASVAVVAVGSAVFEFNQKRAADLARKVAQSDREAARAELRRATERATQAEEDLASLQRAVEAVRAAAGKSTPAPSPAGRDAGGFDPNAGANGALFAYLGNPVPPPVNLNPRYLPESLVATFRQLSDNAGLKVRQLTVDTSEYPFLVYGSLEGAHDLVEIQKGLEKLPGYAYSGSSSGRGSYDGNFASFFAINIVPREKNGDPTGAANRRLMLRLAMLQERAMRSEWPVP